MKCYICKEPAMAELIMCEVCRLKTENKMLEQDNKDLRNALEQVRDDDQLRGFQYQDIAREALEAQDAGS